ncbi:hypothetical protein DCAR_0205742 [Daucus carota subsp. sativus]|uniref:Uncharacterized protein n=1 Tax=Daucus carota subsp. sativus TaxID=79200 RepID=A0A175YBY8_DAUCS|nr:hypothetical protein DCAR_0205742 [Daucus carota subsp. sativus]
MLSDAMVKIFSTKMSGWNGIPSYIRKLTHSMVYGYKVNVGKMVMAQLHSAITKNVYIYPRFVTMFLNDISSTDENASNTMDWFILKKNTRTSLINSELHNGMRLQYTKHMSDHVSNLGSSFTDDLVIFSLEDEARVDPTQANPHSSKYIPFKSSRQPKSLQKAQTVSEKRTIEADEEDSENVEGETAQVAANKDGVVKEPTVQQSYLLSTSYLLSGLHSLSPVHTVVFTQTNNIVSTNLVVTPLQHPHPDVIIEDKSKHVPISTSIKGKSRPSSFLHINTAHTHAARALSLESSTMRSHEVTLKHIESERTPTASRPQNLPSNLKRLRTGVPLIQASSRLSSLEEKVFVMSDKFDSLFKSVAEGFSKIRAALESFTTLLHAANLRKGEKYNISDKGNEDQTSGEPQGRASEKELGGASTGASGKRELGESAPREQMKQPRATVSRTVLPPVTIREPAFGSSALNKRFRQREEEIAKGKGKQKLVEYADIFNAYGDGEEFDLVEATVIMVNDNESKQQFEKLIHDAKAGIGNRLMNWSDKIREQVADFCVIVNEKHRWFVYVYLKNQYTLYFTMECLQLQATIVLYSLLSTMMKKEIPVNQILNITHSNVINEKALEIYMNPFTIYYRMKCENSDKFGVVNLNETRMGLPGNKYVLKKILAFAINAERNSAVQKLHPVIVQRYRSQDRLVKDG